MTWTVHPRACGELDAPRNLNSTTNGSSPRLRGTPVCHVSDGERVRFIPAPAGNSFRCAGRLRCCAVHPRACGELMPSVGVSFPKIGSSPRLRGTQAGSGDRCEPRRFIPAPAGNSPSPICLTRRQAVHPRACGELNPAFIFPLAYAGSSPRLRGTPMADSGSLQALRFIPAPAGNSLRRSSLRSPIPVHPRACGELRLPTRPSPPVRGSSPRLRGTLAVRPIGAPVHRFIPAPAGNSPRLPVWPSVPPVHPRACGELTFRAIAAALNAGSSPRLRGTHRKDTRNERRKRFIPAPAGNSRLSALVGW